MADFTLKLALLPLAFAAAGCDRQPEQNSRSSITVKLPPARPHRPAPGFRDVANMGDSLQAS
jgi:hypothetical protein